MPSLRPHGLRLLLLAGLLLAFGLRLHRLGAESLWYDETVSAYLAGQPIPDLIAHTARDIHPPGYYLLLHGWRLLTAPTLAHGLEFLYAWPSLCFGMLTLALIGAIAQRAGGPAAALLAIMLGALNPFQVMYSQEVRMYTLGSAAALLTWWAADAYLQHAVRPGPARRRAGLLALYVAAALAGLYTLYYFLFWLAVLVPLVTLALMRAPRPHQSRTVLRDWLLAQVALLAGWGPWLPIFLRQAIDPPVPPWRSPWATWREFATSAAEALAAPAAGQSPPAASPAWVWAALVLGVLAAFVVYTKKDNPREAAARWMLPALLLGPAALIFALSLALTPLYHVRYLVPYAALFPVIAALLIARLRARPWVAAGVTLLLAASSAVALTSFWRAPDLRADDHRAAVAMLARAWRPGDAILVNAGWVYPALAVYWPQTPAGPRDAAPPPITAFPRLSAFLQPAHPPDVAGTETPLAPVVIRAGSVDAPPTLGWGRADSDFYALSAADTLAALDTLAASYSRVWHYRLYDTVSDPTGVIRRDLAAHGPAFFSATLPGPGYLLLEGYPLDGPRPDLGPATGSATFGGSVRLRSAQAPTAVAAGSYLYVATVWDEIGDNATGARATSLRLYAHDGTLVAQADAPLLDPTAPEPRPQSLALPVPAATAPSAYFL
ncbi:MAG: hypothetical protein DCC57_08175, partial [Chloroflexi bacterium]